MQSSITCSLHAEPTRGDDAIGSSVVLLGRRHEVDAHVQSILVVVGDERVRVGDELDRIRVGTVVETLAFDGGEEALDPRVGPSRQQRLISTIKHELSV